MAQTVSTSLTTEASPSFAATLELLKPITWFAPMWAFMCGLVSGGFSFSQPNWPVLAAGILLAGPLVCGTSQAANDWFDRHVDAINEPHRPIPSGRIPGRWGLYIAILWSAVSLAVSLLLGPWGFGAAIIGLALAWGYSAPPLRLKQNGWWGNAACGFCYEGLAWFTGAVVVTGGLPDWRISIAALLYSLGAHGIMTLNDFKSIDGDRQMGVRSLPVQLGPLRASYVACAVMAVPQMFMIALLIQWDRPAYALIVAGLLAGQGALMARWLQRPKDLAPWYNATGVTLYVLGMLAVAIAIRGLIGGGL